MRFCRSESVFFLFLWLGLMTFGRSQLFRDPGTLWHVAVGERDLATGHFMTTDSFSCTHAGEPWIARQWLAECAMALVHRVSQLDGLLLVTATLLAGLYTWAAHRLIRSGMHWLLATSLVALALAASAFHFHPRPHLATLALLGWTFALLCDFEAGRIPLERLFWLVPAYLVWTNAHDGVLGGLATLGLTVAGWGLARMLGAGGPVPQPRQLLPLAVLAMLCGLTIVVNPYGLEAPRAWLALVGSPVLPRLIDEHGPLLARPTGPMILPLAGVYLAVLLCVRPRQDHSVDEDSDRAGRSSEEIEPRKTRKTRKGRRRASVSNLFSFRVFRVFRGSMVLSADSPSQPPSAIESDASASGGSLLRSYRVTWLVPLFWLVLAFTRIRHGPLFAITALVALADLFPQSGWAARLVRAGSDLYRPPPDPVPQSAGLDWRPALIPVVLVLTSMVLQLAGARTPVLGRGWAALDRRYWPVDLLPELRAYERAHPTGTPIFNEMLFGGFLIYHTPGLRVFIDDRCELYGDAGLLAYAEALERDPAEVDRWAHEYGFELALTQTGSGFDRYLRRPVWTLVRETASAALHKRTAKP